MTGSGMPVFPFRATPLVFEGNLPQAWGHAGTREVGIMEVLGWPYADNLRGLVIQRHTGEIMAITHQPREMLRKLMKFSVEDKRWNLRWEIDRLDKDVRWAESWSWTNADFVWRWVPPQGELQGKWLKEVPSSKVYSRPFRNLYRDEGDDVRGLLKALPLVMRNKAVWTEEIHVYQSGRAEAALAIVRTLLV